MVGDSTARSHADRYSDIEIRVFWHNPPTEAERKWAIDQAGGDLIRMYPFRESKQAWCDDLMIGRKELDQPKSGLLVEVTHHTVDYMDVTLRTVLRAYDPDKLKQNLIAGVVEGIPISGSEYIAAWKEQATKYPRELSLAVIRLHAQINHF
jgi:hypothetical protein